MASTSDILVNFQGVDNVSPVAQQVGSNVGNMTGGIKNSMGQLGSAFSGLNGLIMGAFGAFGLSTFKNMTYGYATTREELLSLHEAMYGTGEEVDKLWDEMDTMTTEGYVQLDNLSQVMSNFKMSTGASTNQAREFAVQVNKIGNMAILMGKSEAQSTMIMQGAIQGLNGNFRTLQFNLGITRDKLKAMGWSGNAKDINGYTKALEKYLSTIDTSNLLDSTQGKLISLQKRFRIAGRNMGMSMLPIINAIFDGITKINAESDDMLAKVVILSTGALSGFASILPTISPLIQLYEFFGTRIEKLARQHDEGAVHFARTRQVLSPLTKTLQGINIVARDFIAIPLANKFREVALSSTEWIRVPVVSYVSRLNSAIREAYNSHIKYGSALTALRGTVQFHRQNLASGVTGVGKITGAVGKASDKFLNFAKAYGTVDSKMKVARIQQLLYNRSVEQGILAKDMETATAMENEIALYALMGAKTGNIAENEGETISTYEHSIATASLNTNLAILVDLMTKVVGMMAFNIEQTQLDAIANGEDATAIEAKNIALGETIAMTQASVGSSIEKVGALQAETVATGEATGGWLAMAIAEMVALWPILLVIGAIVALIVIVDQIGKTLGWWDDWSSMLEAIYAGLQRLWSAFINNPNVQGFIKDIQGLFGALGGAIQWVAWQILQLFGWEDDGGEFDFVRFLIDGFGTLGRILGDIVNAIKRVIGAFASFINFLATTDGPIGFVRDGLKTIICALMGCSPGIIPALEMMSSVFTRVFGGIVSFITNPVGTIVGRFKEIITGAGQIGDMVGGFLIRQINKFLDFLGPLGSAIRGVFSGALPILGQIITTITGTIGQVWGVISDMFSGKITVDQGINKIISLVKPALTILYNIFLNIFNRIKNYVINTARNMVNGFIGFILSIPQRVMGIFNTLLTNLLNLPSQVFNTGKEIGQGIYDGIDNTVSGLTGGLVHLPGANQGEKKGKAKTTSKTVGNVNKNYNNTGKTRHYTINVGKGAIQLDARNLTTKESKQIMINALEGLTSLSPVNTKANAQK